MKILYMKVYNTTEYTSLRDCSIFFYDRTLSITIRFTILFTFTYVYYYSILSVPDFSQQYVYVKYYVCVLSSLSLSLYEMVCKFAF